MIRFGPSGNSQSFYDQGNKSSTQMPKWLYEIGLNAYEYQCSKGINISEATARSIGEEANKYNIFLSIHAPYYINMASPEIEKREGSKKYIMNTLEVARWMGANRIVIHTGSCSKVDRRWAVDTAKQVLRDCIKDADSSGLGDITICPEVLGKMNQLGDLDEILEMCKIDERLIPTIDFAHIHARGMGSLNSYDDFLAVASKIENELGYERLKRIHVHFSRVEFTKGGEKRHWSLTDTQYGPEFSLFAKLIAAKALEPVIICESRENMAEDALTMKEMYENEKNSCC